MRRIVGSIEHERIIYELETKLVDLMLEHEEVQERAKDLEKKNARLKAECAAFLSTNRGLIDRTHELDRKGDALAMANAQLCDVLARGVTVVRNAEAALATQRFEIDRLQGEVERLRSVLMSIADRHGAGDTRCDWTFALATRALGPTVLVDKD